MFLPKPCGRLSQFSDTLLGGLLAFHRRSVLMRALKQKEGEFRALLESAPDAIAITDGEGRIVLVNTQAQILFGFERKELIGRALGMLFPEWARGRSGASGPEDFSEVVARHMGKTIEMRGLRKGGKESPFEVRLGPVKEIEGDLFACGIRDITERKQAEQALANERDLLHALMDNLPDYIYFKDPQSRFLRTNRAHATALGLSDPAQAVGKTDFDFFPQEDAKNYYEDEMGIFQTGQSLTGRLESVRQPDGRLCWCSTTKVPIRDDQGRVRGLVGITRDVTEQKRAEEELLFKTTLLEAESETTIDGILVVDPVGHVLQFNQRFVEMWSLPPDLVSTQDDHKFLEYVLTQLKDPKVFVEQVKYLYAHQSDKTREEIEFKDGRFFDRYSAPLRDAKGKYYGRIWYFRDITARKQAEQQTRLQTTALASAANGIAIIDREGCILWINPAFTSLSGYSAEEILGQNMRILKSGNHEADFYRSLWQTILSGEVWKGEIVNRRKDGTVYTDESIITPVRDTHGTITHFVAIMQDVTERRRAEQALQERTVYLNSLFEISPVGIVVLDTEGRIQMSNSKFEKLFLYSGEEIFGARLDDLIVPMELAAEARTLSALCLGGGGAQATSRRRRKDGTLLDTEIYGVPLVIDSELRGYLGLYQDITERKRAEADLVQYAEDLEVSKAAQEKHAQELARLVEELARERDLLGAVMDNLPDYIYYKDRQGRFLRANPATARVLGLSDPREAVGKTDFDFFPEKDAKDYFRDEQQVMEAGEPLINRIERTRQPDGEYRWFSTSKVPIRDAEGRGTGLVGIGRDITERMQAEETLRASEERYRELFENASDVVYTTGLDTRLTSLNRVGRKILGYSAEEATQLTLEQVVAPKHWEVIKLTQERLLVGVSDITIEVEVTTKDGRRVLLEVSPRLICKDGKPVGVQGIARDITGRDAAELELRQAQKLESVGRLASGIAHEINTPIQFVGDNTRFLQDSFGGLQTLLAKYQELRDTADSGAVSPKLLGEVRAAEEESDCAYLLEEIPKALAQTLDGVSRVATIVRAMKEFAHPESKELAAADLNRALLSTLTVARNELKYVADVETEFGELPLVVCNIGDLNQVFLNLLVNAAHAIGESTKGTGQRGQIRVRTASEGSTVLVSISDTGCGIPEANRTRVFDPFFTTKEVGRGTGQGLAIARSVVVDRHKGLLTFESEVGKGTTFYVRLPIDPGDCSKGGKAP